MKEIKILSKSSTKDPYNVTITINEDKVFINCNCQAGSYNQLCKHKIAIAAGDTDNMADKKLNMLYFLFMP